MTPSASNRPAPFCARFPARAPIALRRLFTFLSAALLTACSAAASPTPFPTPIPPTPLPETMITFRLSLPEPLQPGEAVFLTVLDEVTGLGLNSLTYSMNADDASHHTVILPFPIGSIVKYRYMRQSGAQTVETYTVQEHTSDGRPVRYRLYYVGGQGIVDDTVSRWTDRAFISPSGRIAGQISEATSGRPLPGLLVTAGGAQAITASDGSYLLEGLPPGVHNLVAYALDGAYRPRQQGAQVAADSTTPASFALDPAPLVNVTFTVIVPADTPLEAPVRLAGNLSQLGNTYADLAGGVSTLAARMPILTRQPDGRYTVTLALPAGSDVRYKYTLGDGLWNAEHAAGNSFRLRQIIIPAADAQVSDLVETWRSGAAPVTFDLLTPPETPSTDRISIQFNPGFGWTEPILMWPTAANAWRFVLSSPLESLSSLNYRYCRNDQCSSADDSATPGLLAVGRTVSLDGQAQTITDQVTAWAWLSPLGAATVPNLSITARSETFITGIEFQLYYHPSYSSQWGKILSDVSSLNPGWLFLTPSWSITRQDFPVIEPVNAADQPWAELNGLVGQAHSAGLQVALFPTPRFPIPVETWWEEARRDYPWWVAWFERYGGFILHHADLAEQSGAQALILGGDWLAPALPDGFLANGAPSGVPAEAEALWREILADVREHYSGLLLWALPYPAASDGSQRTASPTAPILEQLGSDIFPPFLDSVDGVYLLWSVPLSTDESASVTDMAAEAGRLMDADLLPLRQRLGIAMILGLSYPSAQGGVTGCPSAPEGGCLAFDRLAQPNPDLQGVALDLQEQEDAYNALLLALNTRDWIDGIVSRGYYPPAALMDKSTSIHGKPAAGVLWYWFPRLTGK